MGQSLIARSRAARRCSHQLPGRVARLAGLIVMVVGIGVGATAATTLVGSAPRSERVIAFMSDRAGPDPHIYVMRADGRSVARVTRRRGDEPIWSPDGRLIAFSRVFESANFVGSSIWVVSPDGTRERRLTRGREAHWEPSWSPDGRRIAFEAGARGRSAIAVVSSSGGPRRLLTRSGGHDQGPAWSPDGRRIVFSRGAQARADLYVMNGDGSAQRRLRRHAGADVDPAWSPDGRWIAFGSGTPASGFHVYVMRANGTGLRRLTTKRGGQPAWSPDGKRVIFASARDGDPDIFVINIDATRERRLTSNTADDVHPAWRP